ncbi:hypothetical protein XI25_12470 [Paenibacillus sp. DMB20]|nr:hypothetical protein XI25_12470 [Paenibacillus sp. DMB20]
MILLLVVVLGLFISTILGGLITVFVTFRVNTYNTQQKAALEKKKDTYIPIEEELKTINHYTIAEDIHFEKLRHGSFAMETRGSLSMKIQSKEFSIMNSLNYMKFWNMNFASVILLIIWLNISMKI